MVAIELAEWSLVVILFSKLNELYLAFFDPANIILDNTNSYFLGWPKQISGQSKNTFATLAIVKKDAKAAYRGLRY